MVARWCRHCEIEIEVPDERGAVCPACGQDPMSEPAFDDAPAFFLADAAPAGVGAGDVGGDDQPGRFTP